MIDGATLTPADIPRLSSQLEAVRAIMQEGCTWELAELAREVSSRIGRRASEASVSARIRDLRKLGLTVVRENMGNGYFLYSLNGATKS